MATMADMQRVCVSRHAVSVWPLLRGLSSSYVWRLQHLTTSNVFSFLHVFTQWQHRYVQKQACYV